MCQPGADGLHADAHPPHQPKWKFADEFEEYQALATTGNSLFGLLRRQEFIAAHTVNNPLKKEPDPDMNFPPPRRQRSKSLCPNTDGNLRLLLPNFETIQSESTEDLLGEDEFPPPNFRHPRRFSAACVDARDITCKHNIKVSISPPPSSTSPVPRPPWARNSHNTDNTGTESSTSGGAADAEKQTPSSIDFARLMPPDLVALIANMPEEPQVNTYRRRSFSITPKGIVHEGDFLVSRIGNTVVSTSMESDLDKGGVATRSRASSFNSQASSAAWSVTSSTGDVSIHKVLLLGSQGVGKTALAQQFMTSEYMGAQTTSFDDGVELTVTVLLDGQESMLEFTDADSDNCDSWKKYNVEAFVVVYSVTDRRSFDKAIDLLYDIRKRSLNKSAVILVANKTDLKRARSVDEQEGRKIAEEYDSKYTEVSAAFNHKVDDLLVGILKQIRLNPERRSRRRRKDSEDTRCHMLQKARENVISRILKAKTYHLMADHVSSPPKKTA